MKTFATFAARFSQYDKVEPADLKTSHSRSHSSKNLFIGDRSIKTKGQLEKLQIDINDFDTPNQLQTAPQQEQVELKWTQEETQPDGDVYEDEDKGEAEDKDEDVDPKLTQDEPSKESKKWMKSVKVEKFDANWRIKSKLFQTIFNV